MRTELAASLVLMLLACESPAPPVAHSPAPSRPSYVAPTDKLPDGAFDRASAAAAIGSGSRSFDQCHTPDAQTGNGHITMTFGNDGTVTDAVVDDGSFIGTPTADCLRQMALQIRARPFDGPPVKVGKSFTLPLPTVQRALPSGSVSTIASLTNEFNWDSCSFPREADEARVDEAKVELRAMVNENGRAEYVEVLLDPGFGFAGAARDCAMRASYRPPRDAYGTPTRAMTNRFRVRFERRPADAAHVSPSPR